MPGTTPETRGAHGPSPSGGHALAFPQGAVSTHRKGGANDPAHRRARTWRIVLQPDALETIAALHPRFGRLKDGAWVPNYSEIARQGGISKQHLSSAVAGRDGTGDAIHAALLGVAATHGLGPDQAWGKLFKLVSYDQGPDPARGARRKRRPRGAKAGAGLHPHPSATHAPVEAPAAMDVHARIRNWAWENGYRLGERGPLRASIIEEYLQAHPDDPQALMLRLGSHPRSEQGS